MNKTYSEVTLENNYTSSNTNILLNLFFVAVCYSILKINIIRHIKEKRKKSKSVTKNKSLFSKSSINNKMLFLIETTKDFITYSLKFLIIH